MPITLEWKFIRVMWPVSATAKTFAKPNGKSRNGLHSRIGELPYHFIATFEGAAEL
jgi:hypothetical protein